MTTESTGRETAKQPEKKPRRVRDWVNLRSVLMFSIIVGGGAGGYWVGSNWVTSQERSENRSAAKVVTRLQTCRNFVMSLTTDPTKKLVIDLEDVPQTARETCFISSPADLVEDMQGIGSGEDFAITVTGVDATVELASISQLDGQIKDYQPEATFSPSDGGLMGLPGAMAAMGTAIGCAAVIGIDTAEQSIRRRRAAA